ncbi:MAG: hypothetical protein ACJAU0_000598 [Flavobacteriales bacterium]
MSTWGLDVVDYTNSISESLEGNYSVVSMNGCKVLQSSFPSPLNCEIGGMDGKQIAFAKGKSSIELKHQGLALGIYILPIWNQQRTLNQKLWIIE